MLPGLVCREMGAEEADKVEVGTGKNVGGSGGVRALMHGGIEAGGDHHDWTMNPVLMQLLHERGAAAGTKMMVREDAVRSKLAGEPQCLLDLIRLGNVGAGEGLAQRIAGENAIILTVVDEQKCTCCSHRTPV